MKYQSSQFIDSPVRLTLGGFTAPSSGVYPYSVSNSSGVIYNGNVYLEASATSVTLDITDIVAADVTIPQMWSLGSTGWTFDNGYADAKWEDTYTINLTVGTSASTGSARVIHATHYPNYDPSMDTQMSGSGWWGMGGQVPVLQSHYPAKKTNAYGVALAIRNILSADAELKLKIEGGGHTTSAETVTATHRKTVFYAKRLNDLTMFTPSSITGCGCMILLDPNLYSALYPFAEFDKTPARYYLMWMDRYGGIQSQPFAKTPTFTEDVAQTTITNALGVRKVIGVESKPKWEINSGWIEEYLYPYYESIYCSPFLYLYDALNDEGRPVILADTSYTEKTFNNQGRQLFNLQLNLEASIQPKLIY